MMFLEGGCDNKDSDSLKNLWYIIFLIINISDLTFTIAGKNGNNIVIDIALQC